MFIRVTDFQSKGKVLNNLSHSVAIFFIIIIIIIIVYRPFSMSHFGDRNDGRNRRIKSQGQLQLLTSLLVLISAKGLLKFFLRICLSL